MMGIIWLKSASNRFEQEGDIKYNPCIQISKHLLSQKCSKYCFLCTSSNFFVLQVWCPKAYMPDINSPNQTKPLELLVSFWQFIP